MTIRPDPTFHATAKLAMEALAEKYAYCLMLSPDFSQPDGLGVVDVDPKSSRYGKIVHTVMMPNKGDEFHHFGWNACSSALSPLSGHAFLERRYLIIPGLRSSRIYVIDTKPDPTKAKIHKIIEPEEVFRKTGYSRPHTIYCGPEGIYVSTLGGGGPDGQSARPESSSWIARHSMCSVAGRWTEGRRTSTTISGGTCRATTWYQANGDYHRSSRKASFPKICSAINMATEFTSGICVRDAMSKLSTWAPTIRWLWRSGLRTTRLRNTVLSALWWTPPTSRARFGRGGAKAANSIAERPRSFHPSRRRRSSFHRCFRGSAPCRH